MDGETRQAFAQVSREIGELASATKAGFDAVDKRLDWVDKKFEMIGKKFTVVDEQFLGIHKRLDTMDEKLTKTNKRVEMLYGNVEGFMHLHRTLDADLAAVRLHQGRLDERVTRLEQKQ
jgi:tetrahydromethanopterin S-methyltransferase subunit G